MVVRGGDIVVLKQVVVDPFFTGANGVRQCVRCRRWWPVEMFQRTPPRGKGRKRMVSRCQWCIDIDERPEP